MSRITLNKAEKVVPQPEKVVQPKPTNVFYVWYPELCRRAGMQPLNYVKPARPKNDNVLDFVADRIKPDEWTSVLSALRRDTSLHVIAVRSRAKCKFLDDIDTKEKVQQMKRRAGSLHTTYICRALIKAITRCMALSQVLSSLELDGIPIGIEDVEVLVAALQQNKIIKVLTFKYCNIAHVGCQILCSALKQIPNIEVLNLTGCKLDAKSAQAIAKVVKAQQISRYCESWHNSLRYENPEVGIMAGLRRITLNNNPGIGDLGVNYILDELDDDLWIKALDMQRCGVTEAVADRLVDVIEYSRSLEIADFRHNQLELTTINKILDLLKEKHSFGSVSEFKWCLTTTTLPTTANLPETQSKCSFYPAGKSKSVPIKSIPVFSEAQLRRPRTNMSFGIGTSQSGGTTPNLTKLSPSVADSVYRPEFQRSLTSLHSKLQRETNKRIRVEQENKKLKEELERVRSAFISVESNVSIAKERTVKYNSLPRKVASKGQNKPKKPEMLRADHTIKPAMNVEFVFERDAAARRSAYDIVQNIVHHPDEDIQIGEDQQELAEFFQDTIDEAKGAHDDGYDDDGPIDCEELSDDGSQASLIKFMCEIKGTK